MKVIRPALILLVIVALASLPVLTGQRAWPTQSPTAHAAGPDSAPVARSHKGDNDNNGNDNNRNDNNGNDNNGNNNGNDNNGNNNGNDNNGNGNDNNGNGNDNNGNGNDNNGNDNEENENVEAAPPPPPPPPSEVSACLSAGQELKLQLPGGNVRVLVLGQNVQITLKKIDPSSVPGTPGPRVDDLVWQLAASSCGGAGLAQLPNEVNVGVDYLSGAVGGLNQANFTIAVLEGGQWSPSQKQAADPPNTYVSATETRLGTYTVYQR
jgi:hypothetical protein